MRARRATALAATTVLSLGLAACASGGTSDAGSASPSTPATSAPASSAAATSEPPAPSPSPPGSSSAAATSKPPAETSQPAPAAGAYIDLAAYEAGKQMYDAGTVVLFFNATWCPTCQEATGNFEADPGGFGPGVTVVSVDYDSNTDLRKKYGITYQHTFVQVDADGNELATWSGSSTPAEVAEQLA
ncbi:MAG: thioredoxin family protein [Candidatus Nanopelagicales bacterium]